MKLNRISIVNYKNIMQAELEFSPKINCFIGNNGVGKTNVLDAMYYLSFCKSHSNLIDNQNINHESEFFVIDGQYERNGTEENVYCALKRRQKKVFKHNKKEYEKLADHIGKFPLVLISPDDISLMYEGSETRRKFIDGVISQYDLDYLTALLRYNKTLQQRNALLKNDNPSDELLTIFDGIMHECGIVIFRKRKEFIDKFIPIFQQYYEIVSQNKESVNLEYDSQLLRNENLGELLGETHERDKILGYTTRGIHKDDLLMSLGELPIKRVGSQGQNKTYLIALKFAQFEFLKQIHREKPILLLDDLFDKLDAERVQQIIHLVANDRFGQIFITDTNRKNLDEILRKTGQDFMLFGVEKGNITQLP
ncbi:MAG: DNA replication and repair protein RecF [Paludibacteraceae bacterium]|nr:DNA replication and repair protein RecF [Paludibacteraceae bacterium]